MIFKSAGKRTCRNPERCESSSLRSAVTLHRVVFSSRTLFKGTAQKGYSEGRKILKLEFFKNRAAISILAVGALLAGGHDVRANDVPRDTAALPIGIDVRDEQTTLPVILPTAASIVVYSSCNKTANGGPRTTSSNSSATRCS